MSLDMQYKLKDEHIFIQLKTKDDLVQNLHFWTNNFQALVNFPVVSASLQSVAPPGVKARSASLYQGLALDG